MKRCAVLFLLVGGLVWGFLAESANAFDSFNGGGYRRQPSGSGSFNAPGTVRRPPPISRPPQGWSGQRGYSLPRPPVDYDRRTEKKTTIIVIGGSSGSSGRNYAPSVPQPSVPQRH